MGGGPQLTITLAKTSVLVSDDGEWHEEHRKRQIPGILGARVVCKYHHQVSLRSFDTQ